MVQGMAFLSKKRFNPQNLSNQKAVWEARQQKEKDAKRIQEREDQLRRERDDEELARARGGARGGDEAAMRFMYGPPPGLPPAESSKTESKDNVLTKEPTTNDVTKRQPGDDDAAAAFRQMLAASAPAESTMSPDRKNDSNVSGISGAALTGTTIEAASKGNEGLSALEKAVGRKDAGKSLTLEEQVARFPQLKNAPMAKGMSSTNVNVNFKPLGTQLRHIRCLACGVWGHSRGDRECELSGWNPFAASTKPPAAAAAAVKTDSQARGKSESVDSSKKTQSNARKDDDLNWDLRSDKSSSDSEDSRRRRKKREKRHKSSSRHRRHDSKRRRSSRSSSPEDRRSRKKSHKRRRKHSSRHD